MTSIDTLCIFCGSNVGRQAQYVQGAQAMGQLLVRHHIRLVYGGGKVGLMGALADAMLAEGGEVVGVIPDFLMEMEVGHAGLTELHVVDSMHTRKQLMAELSDAFVAMPGGIGTLEELFEVFTWAQLGLHRKPLGLLNLEGYYDPLMGFFQQMIKEEFFRHENREMLSIHHDPEALLELLRAYDPPHVRKWLRKGQE